MTLPTPIALDAFCHHLENYRLGREEQQIRRIGCAIFAIVSIGLVMFCLFTSKKIFPHNVKFLHTKWMKGIAGTLTSCTLIASGVLHLASKDLFDCFLKERLQPHEAMLFQGCYLEHQAFYVFYKRENNVLRSRAFFKEEFSLEIVEETRVEIFPRMKWITQEEILKRKIDPSFKPSCLPHNTSTGRGCFLSWLLNS